MHKKYFYTEKKKMKQLKKGMLMVRGIGNIFQQIKDYHKPVRVDNFGAEIILTIKATEIEVKYYELKNILIKLDHI